MRTNRPKIRPSDYAVIPRSHTPRAAFQATKDTAHEDGTSSCTLSARTCAKALQTLAASAVEGSEASERRPRSAADQRQHSVPVGFLGAATGGGGHRSSRASGHDSHSIRLEPLGPPSSSRPASRNESRPSSRNEGRQGGGRNSLPSAVTTRIAKRVAPAGDGKDFWKMNIYHQVLAADVEKGQRARATTADSREEKDVVAFRPGLLDNCLHCDLQSAEDANFCRKCSKKRLPKKVMDDFMRLYTGDRRLLRRRDTVSLKLHLIGVVGRQPERYNARCEECQLGHFVTNLVDAMYDKILDEQLHGGGPQTTQGLKVDNLQHMVQHIAWSLDASPVDLVFDVCQEGGLDVVLRPSEVKKQTVHQPLMLWEEGTCQSCGNQMLPDAQFCRKCGAVKAKKPTDVKSFRADLWEIVEVARKHHIDIMKVRDMKDLFMNLCKCAKGSPQSSPTTARRLSVRARKPEAPQVTTLSFHEFEEVTREKFVTLAGDPLDAKFIAEKFRRKKRFGEAGWEQDDGVGFEEFLLWTLNTQWEVDMQPKHRGAHWQHEQEAPS
eukprot:TRINITY_DN101212_c0_g1_i1.p1 TRINITY_DN101212_c0_g1~~TRINITY_DN101212_c0_g1_i1.p1  ORF type:complete len:550 (-),score=112.70 TRINITY_DN101212_c0_g1_i1:147-1796(-)